MTTKTAILNRLKVHWDYAAQYFDEDRFLGIFLYGSQNYGTELKKSDIDSKIILLPTFNDFCLSPEMVSKEITLSCGEKIDIKDIRLFRQNCMKHSINYIETLFTEYYILNPKYENLFKLYFINNREDIAHCDQEKAILNVSHQIFHTLKQNPMILRKYLMH